MREYIDATGNSIYVSTTPDCGTNKGGFFCQVYADESLNYEIDDFGVHPTDCDCTNENEVEEFIENYVGRLDYTDNLTDSGYEDEDDDNFGLERFKEKVEDLSSEDKIAMYNDFCSETGGESIEYFDNDFFEAFFADKMEVCRATAYGEVNFSDEYIRLDAYGNLESFGEWEALDIVEESLDEIYEYKHIWKQYI